MDKCSKPDLHKKNISEHKKKGEVNVLIQFLPSEYERQKDTPEGDSEMFWCTVSTPNASHLHICPLGERRNGVNGVQEGEEGKRNEWRKYRGEGRGCKESGEDSRGFNPLEQKKIDLGRGGE